MSSGRHQGRMLMSREDQRHVALRLILLTAAGVACVLGWLALLTFSPADPPAQSVWPLNDPPHNWCGVVGAWLAFHLFYYLGIGAVAILLLLTAAVAARARGAKLSDPWLRTIGLMLICTAASSLATLWTPASEYFLITGPGGVLGSATAAWLQANLQTAGTVVMLLSALFVGLVLAADEVVIRAGRWMIGVGRRSGPALVRGGSNALATAGAAVAAGVSQVSARAATASDAPADSVAAKRPSKPIASRPHQLSLDAALDDDDDEPAEHDTQPADEYEEDDEPVDQEDSQDAAASDSPQSQSPLAKTTPPTQPAPRVTDLAADSAGGRTRGDASFRREPDGDYELPHLTLLGEPDPIDKDAIEYLCREKAYILEQTLNEFKLEVKVVAIETGPVITVFELKLAPGIKVSQIASLTNDMARALKAPAVRVVAPLPNKNTIGIEVPNLDKEKVRIKDLIRMYGSRIDGHGVPLYLGKDASGQPLVSDLTKMPHLLIAGTTGSGKSVCISSIIMSILLTRTPEQIKLILVDPKVVELAMFKDIPHLMCPIVTEVSKAEGILDWAATKMDERYAMLAEAGVKDIRSYNRLGEKGLRERMQIEADEEMTKIPIHLPYIVIVIDELADLMMTSAKEVEFFLCRLAQKSRAVGIHLIVSTQRPQANVVTGLIKSNLPSRICFRVSSRLDSRIVLDQNGGEVLMGQGDMLFLPPGSAKLVRAQGTFIADDELRGVVKHSRGQRQPEFNPELIRMPGANVGSAGERDELFDEAVGMIIESGRGSVSLLQRRLNVGYSRASRLIDQMYDAGIVGEYKGSQAREVMMDKSDWESIRNQRDREEAAEV